MKRFAVLAGFAGLALCGCATPSLLGPAQAGATHYHYELLERVPGQPDRGYRADYDIETGRDHGMVAVVHHASELANGAWRDAQVDADCAAALHAGNGELARVRLWPLSEAAAQSMNADFMALCAPAALFYPMSDILNVALIEAAPQFKLASLHAVGDHARFDAYATQFERLGAAISVAAPGGEVRLQSVDAGIASVLWRSDPMQLRIIHRATANEPEITLEGVENYAFRVDIEARTGVVQRAVTTSDALDLTVVLPGAPPGAAPHIRVTRDVTITRLP